jgi:hypothetical protein
VTGGWGEGGLGERDLGGSGAEGGDEGVAEAVFGAREATPDGVLVEVEDASNVGEGEALEVGELEGDLIVEGDAGEGGAEEGFALAAVDGGFDARAEVDE